MRERTHPTWGSIFMFFLGLFFTQTIAGQSVELGGFAGYSNYIGDLQETQFEMSEANLTYGGFVRFNLSNHVALRTHYYKGQLSGSDHNFTTPDLRERNLSFRTDFSEFGIVAEIALVNFGANKKKIASSYIFGGVAALHFNPQAEIDGEWVDLQPLGTEGQGLPGYKSKYSKYTLAYPMGVGFRFNLARVANLGLVLGWRKSETDYIDDVSEKYPDISMLQQVNPKAAALSFREPEITGDLYHNPVGEFRGDPSKKDWYLFIGTTFSIYLVQSRLPK